MTASLRRYLLPLALFLLGAGLCAWLVPFESHEVDLYLVGFPDADVFGHRLRPLLLGALFLLPAFGGLMYAFSDTLDRYLVRQFLPIFLLCLGGLLMLWILIDLADNLADFRRSPDSAATALRFYLTQFPSVFVLLIPYSLLLSLLYSLGKLSSSREIVAMIQTGRGMLRLVAPLLLVGLLVSAACMIFNYHWAPWAEGHREIMLTEARGGRPSQATNVLYYETDARRLWKVGEFPLANTGQVPLLDVEITEMHPDGTLDTRLLAKRATWERHRRRWSFEQALIQRFQAGAPPTFETAPDPLVRGGWPETPWQLIKPGLPATALGIPDLNSWLEANRNVDWSNKLPYLTQWHHRWAQPVVCLITVLLAAPLGIVFSRRGASGAVAIAVFLCGGMLFLSTVSLALGESGYIKPALAAWLTNAVFGFVALLLFHRRMSGRPIYQTIRRLIPTED